MVAAEAIGVFTGLLANGGGFLVVPLSLVVLGLGMRQSAATSLVVIAALSVPTLAMHWALGHVDWRVAGAFAAGAVPGGFLAAESPIGTATPLLNRLGLSTAPTLIGA